MMIDSQVPEPGRTSVLVVDHTALNSETRWKWRELESQGFRVHVLCPDRWMENFRPLTADEEGAPAGGLTIGKVSWAGKENRGFYRRGIREAINRVQPQVAIIMAERYSWFTAQCAAALTGRRRPIPFLFYAWDNLSTRTWTPYFPSLIYQILGRLCGNRAAGAMVANREAASVLKRCGFSPPVWLVPYCVELRANHLRARQSQAGPLRVGFLGRLIHGKGADILLDALACIGNRYSISAAIAGDGPEATRLQRMAVDIGVDKMVRWDGHLIREAVPAWLAGLDVIVVPSRTTRHWKEQFGRVLVEAMALGVVPIGSDSGAIPEVIGDAGVVIREADPVALADAFMAVGRNAERRRELAARAEARAWSEYSPEAFARRVASVVRAVLRQ